jgi:hypothetical protein
MTGIVIWVIFHSCRKKRTDGEGEREMYNASLIYERRGVRPMRERSK